MLASATPERHIVAGTGGLIFRRGGGDACSLSDLPLLVHLCYFFDRSLLHYGMEALITKLYRMSEIARMLGVPKSWLNYRLLAGKTPVNKKIAYTEKEVVKLKAWLAEQQANAR